MSVVTQHKKCRTPGLLVSVRDLAEARAALVGGADIIDVKEPRFGSLGAATVGTVESIVRFVRGRVPVTAALGELVDFEPRLLPEKLFAAKVGLAGCSEFPNEEWGAHLAACFASFPAKRVAVAYADYQTCKSPSPEKVVDVAVKLKCDYLLIDTHKKTCPLTSLMRSDADVAKQLGESIAAALDHGLSIVVAGSLDVEDFRLIISQWQPDFLAVRGAACDGNREAQVSGEKVAHLKRCLIEASAAMSNL